MMLAKTAVPSFRSRGGGAGPCRVARDQSWDLQHPHKKMGIAAMPVTRVTEAEAGA